MKVICVLMIRNEANILLRCLESVISVVQVPLSFCIVDTGSTDNTVTLATEFLKEHDGTLYQDTWKNFGHNRSLSFQHAREFVNESLKEKSIDSLKEMYALVLDADMVLRGKITDNLKREAYSFLQKGNGLEYKNLRLLRMDVPWVCNGVTHEYWHGATGEDYPSAYIHDISDGGHKHDKFIRDENLLKEGLAEDPKNERYMFYLAQTLLAVGKNDEAKKYYKKRIQAGGWYEEICFSYLQLGRIHKSSEKMEMYMNKCLSISFRHEPLVELVTKYRTEGHHYKAWHYLEMANRPIQASLFIDTTTTETLLYERTILSYYVKHDLGKSSMEYMIKYALKNVHDNLIHYAKPIGGTPMNFMNHVELEDNKLVPYFPSSVSTFLVGDKRYFNIRYVNYSYRQGRYDSYTGIIKTMNASSDLKTNSVLRSPSFGTRVQGLEDVRVFHDASGALKFFATVVLDKISIVKGSYNVNKDLTDIQIMKSPTNNLCEKNWQPIDKTNKYIYRWSPFEIYENETLIFSKQICPLFSILRGSSNVISYKCTSNASNECYAAIVHSVHGNPRIYLHYLVLFNESMVPTSISVPFYFQKLGIEFCLSLWLDGSLRVAYSVNDERSYEAKLPDLLMIPL